LPLAARFVHSIGSGRGSRVLLGYRLGAEAVWVVADPARGTAAVDDVPAAELLLEVLEAAGGALSASDAAAPRTGRGPWREAGGAPPWLASAPDPGVIACALAVARPVLAARRAAAGIGGSAAGVPPRSVAARAARRLQTLLGAVPGGPDAALCARADIVLAALGENLDAGTEEAVRAVLARHGGGQPVRGGERCGSTPGAAGDESGPPGGGAAAEALALLEAFEGVVGTGADVARPGARPPPGNAEGRRRRLTPGAGPARPVLLGILEFAGGG